MRSEGNELGTMNILKGTKGRKCEGGKTDGGDRQKEMKHSTLKGQNSKLKVLTRKTVEYIAEQGKTVL